MLFFVNHAAKVYIEIDGLQLGCAVVEAEFVWPSLRSYEIEFSFHPLSQAVHRLPFWPPNLPKQTQLPVNRGQNHGTLIISIRVFEEGRHAYFDYISSPDTYIVYEWDALLCGSKDK